MRAFSAIVGRDIRIAFRQLSDTMLVVIFFAIVAALFPFGVGIDPNLLARMAPGILWVAALLASMLSLDRMFRPDYEDGTLEQLVIAPVPLWVSVLAKIVSHWLSTGLPLLAAALPTAIMFNLSASGCAALAAAMIPGTLVISHMGALGAALTLGARRSGVLVPLLVLPLLVPVLIFGASAVEAAIAGFSARPQILALTGLMLACVVLCPWAGAAALKAATE